MSSFWNRFARYRAMMRQIVMVEPALLQRLADAPDKTAHVYAIALDHKLASDPQLTAHAAAAHLKALHLRDLLADAWGDTPEGALAALDRCGPMVASPSFYAKLRRCLRAPRLAKFVRGEGGNISIESLDHAIRRATLDPALDVIREPMRFRDLSGIDWLVRLLRAVKGETIDDKWLHATLRRIGRGDIRQPLIQLLRAFPHVEAPWPGDDLLRSVETVEELQVLGREMKNCLAEPRYALGLVRGSDAFYVKRKGEPAAVHIRKVDGGDWCIVEMRGRSNRRLNREETEEIQISMLLGGIYEEEHPSQHLKEMLGIW